MLTIPVDLTPPSLNPITQALRQSLVQGLAFAEQELAEAKSLMQLQALGVRAAHDLLRTLIQIRAVNGHMDFVALPQDPDIMARPSPYARSNRRVGLASIESQLLVAQRTLEATLNLLATPDAKDLTPGGRLPQAKGGMSPYAEDEDGIGGISGAMLSDGYGGETAATYAAKQLGSMLTPFLKAMESREQAKLTQGPRTADLIGYLSYLRDQPVTPERDEQIQAAELKLAASVGLGRVEGTVTGDLQQSLPFEPVPVPDFSSAAKL